jgi:GNAT superfamily N-acetyltransferase
MLYMNIRKAVTKDIDQLSELILDFYKEGEIIEPVIGGLNKSAKKYFRDYLKETINSKEAVIFVFEKNNIIGFIIGCVKKNEPFFKIKVFSKLTDFYVIPSERRKGIGDQLLKQFLYWSKKRKATHIFLGTLSKNKLTTKMYENKGFFEFEKEYWKKINK